MQSKKMSYFWLVQWPWFCLILAALVLGVVAAFGSYFVKKQLDSISLQDKATKRLDAHSLSILEQMDGLHFPQASNMALIEALRQLTSIELIELDVFPSDPYLTHRYYLTTLGRYILEEKLHRHIFPNAFCEMIRIRYWRRSDQDFEKKEFKRRKDKFAHDFHINWEDAWVIFDSVIRLKEKQKEDMSTMGRWESYDQRLIITIAEKMPLDEKNMAKSMGERREKLFETISSEVVKLWGEKIKNPKALLPSEQEREKILRLDGLLYE